MLLPVNQLQIETWFAMILPIAVGVELRMHEQRKLSGAHNAQTHDFS
jgi:hypothetical protein